MGLHIVDEDVKGIMELIIIIVLFYGIHVADIPLKANS